MAEHTLGGRDCAIALDSAAPPSVRSAMFGTTRVVSVVGSIARGVTVADEMGSFRTDIELENPARPGERRRVEALLVDTGSELTWVPAPILESIGVTRVKQLRFRQATGAIVERWTGEARVHGAGTRTIDEIVFGEPGDLALLGARTLAGLNVVVDPVHRRLVDAGAMPAAAA